MMVMSHQYILFEEIPELAAWSKEAGHKLPLLRDVDTSYYLRQEKNGMNLGPYERNCRAHWATHNDPMPDDFSFQLFPDDLERLERYLNDAIARVPILGTAGLSKVINGPIPYAPDGNPLIGPMPGVPNAFEACVFTFGIAQAGGAGKVLAEWVTEGQTEWDMWSCDPRRFTAFAAEPDYAVAKGMEIYGHEYAIQFPAPRLAGRRATASFRRSTTASRRSARSSTPTMAGSARPGTPSRATTHRRKRRRPSGATAPGKSASARSASPCATRPAFSTCPASRASGWMAPARATGCRRMITGVVPKPGTHRPRLFRRRQGPHRHRDVDHGAGRGLFRPDHRRRRANCTTSSGCRSICRKRLE